ncbi:hypothetical protein [Sporosarcina sp. BP05]|uniref:hypothetical protein n=1 Tax=Sporosarcina sp. BP05 TaxID=2758726 RepID=UPI00164684B5|nr:hypothetical protein [Sporosarcina sp. BP05]
MKKKLIVLLTAVSILGLTTACSNDKEEKVEAEKAEIPVEEIDEDSTLKEEDVIGDTEEEMNENDIMLSSLFDFYLQHHKFGKYVNNMKLVGSTIVVDFHNSYKEMKKVNPDSIKFNKYTFPELYEKYVPNNDYKDLNAYLIGRSMFVLANHPNVNRVIINAPPNDKGIYHSVDVNREDLGYVLGFDVSLLKRGIEEEEEDELGAEFYLFANTYLEPISDAPYDDNKRFLNLFIKQQKGPITVEGKEIAAINEYRINLKYLYPLRELVMNSDRYSEYVPYMEKIEVKKNKIFIKFSPTFRKSVGLNLSLVLLAGTFLADYPELESVELKSEEILMKVSRKELIDFLGYDIATLVKTDVGDVNDWDEFDEKFSRKYVYTRDMEDRDKFLKRFLK